MQLPTGPIMSPKIYPIQSLTPGPNGHLAIKGPLGQWDPDVLAVVITVVVSQVTGTANANPSRDRDRVVCPVHGERRLVREHPAVGAHALEPGGAMVAAWATIARTDGGYEMYEWTLPVKFV